MAEVVELDSQSGQSSSTTPGFDLPIFQVQSWLNLSIIHYLVW